MPFHSSAPQGSKPSARINRKTLQDLLALNPEGYAGKLFWFHDVQDEDPSFDRVVVGFYDQETLTSYTGVAIIEDDNVAKLKKYLNGVWAGHEVEAKILSGTDGGLTRVVRA